MLTPLELALMKSLWRRGEATVRQVQDDLVPERPLAYTTVMTVMDRLFKKDLVERRKKSRAHVYRPVVTEAQARREAVGALLDGFFGGSQASLRSYLSGREPVSSPQPSKDAPPLDDILL